MPHLGSPVWAYPPKNCEWKQQIAKEFKIPLPLAQTLVSRNFDSFESIYQLFYSRLPDLHDPFLLVEMDTAVDRIVGAIERSENILIYGDNDVDGMTGTALMTDFLRYVGCKVFFSVSSRGLARENLIVESLEYARDMNCKLVITVDCGITAAKEVKQFTQEGIDVIVTDHHEPTSDIPECTARLNPKLHGNPYPYRELTGVGVCFKFAHAITNKLVKLGLIAAKRPDLKRYLDLVALGTVADMGPLNGENRILVRYGLQQLKKTKRIGLSKLISIADIPPDDISTFTIASKMAPRLNSLGRIANPQKGVELLLIRNAVSAEKMAQELDLNNIERRKIEKTMSDDLDEIIARKPDIFKRKAVALHSKNWHPGVIPILSNRMSRNYHRPAALIAVENGIGKGSLRSIHEFPLLPALTECSDLLINFGGHDYAAGLTIREEHIEEFCERFIESADRQLTESDVVQKLLIDAEITFQELTFDFMESMRLLEPFGHENPQPIFSAKARQVWPPKVVGHNHLKLYLEQDNGVVVEGIAFGLGREAPSLRKKDLELEVAFTPNVNTFMGPSIQLHVRGIKIVNDQKTSPLPSSTHADQTR